MSRLQQGATLPSSSREADEELLGSQTPRIWTPPTGGPTLGPLAIEIAEIAGINLDEWQCNILMGALELDPTRMVSSSEGPWPRWARREVVYEVARQNGKTVIIKVRVLTGLFSIPTDRRITHTAQDRALPREVFEELVEHIQDNRKLHRHLKRRRGIVETNGREQINLKDGSKYVIKAPNAKVWHGPSNDLIIIDELRFQSTDLWGSGIPTQSARPNAQTWGCSNAGKADAIQLQKLEKRGRSAAADPDSDPRMFYAEWSAHPARKPDDPKGWAEANPGLGIRITSETIRDELRGLEADDFETERVCRSVKSVGKPALDWHKWSDCAGEPDEIDPDEIPRPHMAVHISGDRTYAALAIAAERDGRLVVQVPKRWVDADGVDTTVITAEVLAYMKANRVRELAYVKRRAANIATRVVERGMEAKHVDATELIVASQNLEDAVNRKRLIHDGDLTLSEEVRTAGRKTHQDKTWNLSEPDSGDDITGLMAVAFAVNLAYQAPTHTGGFRGWLDE